MANCEVSTITPAPTDYHPHPEAVLKKEPGYAPVHAERFKESEETKSPRPHSYEDPNQRTFRRSNSGSFTRARRFKMNPETSEVWRTTIMNIKQNNNV